MHTILTINVLVRKIVKLPTTTVLKGSFICFFHGGPQLSLISQAENRSCELVVNRGGYNFYQYRGEENRWVKGFVCLILEFALPPFSLPLPSVVEVSLQNRH